MEEEVFKVDRLVEEDAVVEELVDVVVVDVRIVAEDLMALKMGLLAVGAVVRLIEEDIYMGMGVGVGMVELATLINSGLLMILKMVTTTTKSLGISYQTARRSCTKTTRRRSSQHQTDR